MKFRKKVEIPWSGEKEKGSSLSGIHAEDDGLLNIFDFVKWLRSRWRKAGLPGRPSRAVIESTITADEKHHYRDGRGKVELVGFYSPKKALEELIDLKDFI